MKKLQISHIIKNGLKPNKTHQIFKYHSLIIHYFQLILFLSMVLMPVSTPLVKLLANATISCYSKFSLNMNPVITT